MTANKADAQNPAITSLFQIGRHRRRVCDLRRWPKTYPMRTATVLCLTLLSVFSEALAEDAVVTIPRVCVSASNYIGAPPNPPTFKWLTQLTPVDVVQGSIRIRRVGTNMFGVMWTYTEAGAQKAIAFWDAHGERHSEEWKSGWLKWRTDKGIFPTEDAAKSFMAELMKETDG